MNYKYVLLAILALVIDLSIGIFYPNIGPIALIFTAFYFALKLDYPELIFIIFIVGFLYDMSLLSGSIFNVIYLVAIAVSTKLVGRKIIHFSSELIQAIAILVFFLIRVLGFYAIYDRSITSIFLEQNFIAIAIALALLVILNSFKRLYAKQN